MSYFAVVANELSAGLLVKGPVAPTVGPPVDGAWAASEASGQFPRLAIVRINARSSPSCPTSTNRAGCTAESSP
jgi:hypothetical protein